MLMVQAGDAVPGSDRRLATVPVPIGAYQGFGESA